MREKSIPVHNDAAMASVILLLGFVLLGVGQVLAGRWAEASSRNQAFMFEDLLGIVSTASGLAVVLWWSLSLLLAFVAAFLHKTGRAAGADRAAKYSPVFMRRLALAALGLNLIGIPVAHAADGPSPGWHPSPAIGNTAVISAQWTPARASSHPSPLQSATAEDRVIDPGWHPKIPVVDPQPLGIRAQRAAEQIPPGKAPVVVASGDSLWSIAARQLGPLASDVEIARQWPKWYEANRHVIGADPGLLLPGQILQPPATN